MSTLATTFPGVTKKMIGPTVVMDEVKALMKLTKKVDLRFGSTTVVKVRILEAPRSLAAAYNF